MGRRAREEVEGGIAHVWARGNNRQALFLDDADRQRYLSILGAVVQAHGWLLLAYCLMTNHVHLLIETPRANLAAGMCRVHGDYARTFNRRHRRSGHLFGGRYGASRIKDDAQLWATAAYVAANPVRAGLCRTPEDWPWSSHAATLGMAPPPCWLAADHLLARLDLPDPSLYASYVSDHAAITPA